MASQQNRYYASNPDDGVTTYSHVRIYRAPDAGGTAGAFTLIATVAIDASDEYTEYLDTGGEDTSWYQHEWYNATGPLLSNRSPALAAGDSVVRQWLRADMADADVTNTMWDRWTKQTLIDLYNRGISKPTAATITITEGSDGSFNELYDISSSIRDVTMVERVSNDALLRHSDWVTTGQWQQVGRDIRIVGASDVHLYRVHGKRQFNSIGELTDDYFMLAYRMIRLRLLTYRLSQRSNFYRHTIFDKSTDIGIPELRAMIGDAEREIAADIGALAQAEPLVPFGYAGRP